jgi:hypothetical protein
MISTYKNIIFISFYQLYKKNAYILNNKKEPIYVVRNGNGLGSYYLVKNLNKNKYIPNTFLAKEFILNTPKFNISSR